jgi:hypothetical protein
MAQLYQLSTREVSAMQLNFVINNKKRAKEGDKYGSRIIQQADSFCIATQRQLFFIVQFTQQLRRAFGQSIGTHDISQQCGILQAEFRRNQPHRM